MLNIVYAEPKHLRELVKIGHEYFNESRFKELGDNEIDDTVWFETAKACVVAPNVFLQVLVDEQQKVHGFIQASLIPQAWNKKINCAINLIYVKECCKVNGVAEQFLTNVKEWATANHCYEVIAGDYAFNPEATAKWYHKQGYKTVGQQYAIKI